MDNPNNDKVKEFWEKIKKSLNLSVDPNAKKKLEKIKKEVEKEAKETIEKLRSTAKETAEQIMKSKTVKKIKEGTKKAVWKAEEVTGTDFTGDKIIGEPIKKGKTPVTEFGKLKQKKYQEISQQLKKAKTQREKAVKNIEQAKEKVIHAEFERVKTLGQTKLQVEKELKKVNEILSKHPNLPDTYKLYFQDASGKQISYSIGQLKAMRQELMKTKQQIEQEQQRIAKSGILFEVPIQTVKGVTTAKMTTKQVLRLLESEKGFLKKTTPYLSEKEKQKLAEFEAWKEKISKYEPPKGVTGAVSSKLLDISEKISEAGQKEAKKVEEIFVKKIPEIEKRKASLKDEITGKAVAGLVEGGYSALSGLTSLTAGAIASEKMIREHPKEVPYFALGSALLLAKGKVKEFRESPIKAATKTAMEFVIAPKAISSLFTVKAVETKTQVVPKEEPFTFFAKGLEAEEVRVGSERFMVGRIIGEWKKGTAKSEGLYKLFEGGKEYFVEYTPEKTFIGERRISPKIVDIAVSKELLDLPKSQFQTKAPTMFEFVAKIKTEEPRTGISYSIVEKPMAVKPSMEVTKLFEITRKEPVSVELGESKYKFQALGKVDIHRSLIKNLFEKGRTVKETAEEKEVWMRPEPAGGGVLLKPRKAPTTITEFKPSELEGKEVPIFTRKFLTGFKTIETAEEKEIRPSVSPLLEIKRKEKLAEELKLPGKVKETTKLEIRPVTSQLGKTRVITVPTERQIQRRLLATEVSRRYKEGIINKLRERVQEKLKTATLITPKLKFKTRLKDRSTEMQKSLKERLLKFASTPFVRSKTGEQFFSKKKKQESAFMLKKEKKKSELRPDILTVTIVEAKTGKQKLKLTTKREKKVAKELLKKGGFRIPTEELLTGKIKTKSRFLEVSLSKSKNKKRRLI